MAVHETSTEPGLDDFADAVAEFGSYDDAHRLLEAGVSDPSELTSLDYPAQDAESYYDKLADQEARTREMYRALGALSRLSQLSGFQRARPPYADERYLENVSAKRQRLAETARDAFMRAHTGSSKLSGDQRVLGEWRSFMGTFAGAKGAAARRLQREQLRDEAQTNGFELVEVE